jgi:hypothetical protein
MSARESDRRMKTLVIAAAVLVAVFRPFMPLHSASLPGSYEAMAHIFVGGLIGAWLVNRQRWLLFTALAISAVEVICAVCSAIR